MKMTIREAYIKASSFLKERQIADSAICAELLLQHLLGWSRSTFLLRWEEAFPQELAAAWRQLLERKAAGEPVQYITGEQEFFGLPFRVTGAVLIPRPETELLVEGILHEGRKLWPQGAPLLAEIGTGSGAIPVTIARACPAWRVYSSDLSASALEVARGNAAALGVADRVTFFEGDLLQPYIDRRLAVDILVSNPPYIPARDVPMLQPEVRLYEPHSALIGGLDGLDLYRRMTQQLSLLPRQPTLVGFEVGIGQAEAVAELLRSSASWEAISFIKDLAGIDRHVIAVREIF